MWWRLFSGLFCYNFENICNLIYIIISISTKILLIKTFQLAQLDTRILHMQMQRVLSASISSTLNNFIKLEISVMKNYSTILLPKNFNAIIFGF